jgi:hypothetical protein
MSRRPLARLAAALAAGLVLSACGASSSSSSSPSAPGTASASRTSTAVAAGAGTTPAGTTGAAPSSTVPALVAEGQSAAAGDIPDNQAFLPFDDRAAGFAMKYPEGWAQSRRGQTTVFRDKNNVVRVSIGSGSLPTLAAARSELAAERASLPSLSVGGATRTTVAGAPAVSVGYTTTSAPNDVTGRRVKLIVDRYYLARGTRRAVVDLATPEGVDNVDAYRLMIGSFRWR